MRVANVIHARTKPKKITWFIFLLIFFGVCSFYIINSLTSFFAYEVISNIKIHDTREITFPALTFCIWPSNFNLEEAIFGIKFNAKNSEISVENVIIVGYGLSTSHSCIRVNGVGKNSQDGNKPLTSKVNSLVDSGLFISFLLPENVRVIHHD